MRIPLASIERGIQLSKKAYTKVDIAKTFDIVDWYGLQLTPEDMGFGVRFIN